METHYTIFADVKHDGKHCGPAPASTICIVINTFCVHATNESMLLTYLLDNNLVSISAIMRLPWWLLLHHMYQLVSVAFFI